MSKLLRVKFHLSNHTITSVQQSCLVDKWSCLIFCPPQTESPNAHLEFHACYTKGSVNKRVLLKAREPFWQLSHWYFRRNWPHSFLMLHVMKMFSITRAYHFFITLNRSVLFSTSYLQLSLGGNSFVNSVTLDHMPNKYFESITEIPNHIINFG